MAGVYLLLNLLFGVYATSVAEISSGEMGGVLNVFMVAVLGITAIIFWHVVCHMLCGTDCHPG